MRVAEYRVKKQKVLTEDLYCENCGEWVYCPDMNITSVDAQGKEVVTVGEGCLHQDDKGEYIECPGCNARYYIED